MCGVEGHIPDVHAHAGAIETAIPNSRRIVVSDVGHLMYIEKPEEFLTIVTHFLAFLRSIVSKSDLQEFSERSRSYRQSGSYLLYCLKSRVFGNFHYWRRTALADTQNPVLQPFPIRRPTSRQKDETATDLIGLSRRHVPRGANEPIESSAIELFPCQEDLRYLRDVVNVREGVGLEQYEVSEFARSH